MSYLLSKIVDGIQVRQIPKFPNYWVSSHGSIWSDSRTEEYLKSGRKVVRKRKGCWLKLVENSDGYLVFTAYAGKERALFKVASVVLLCWFGESSISDSMILHGNDIKKDNSCLNLRHGTRLDNGADSVKNGKSLAGDKNPNVKLSNVQAVDIKERLALGETTISLAKEYNVTPGPISRIKHGVRKVDVL